MLYCVMRTLSRFAAILFTALAIVSTAHAAAAGAPSLFFQPGVERVLDAGGELGARVYLDFQRGLVTVERLPDDPERNRKLHRDLKLDLTPGREEWTGIDLQVAPAGGEFWDQPADKVIAALADNLAPPLATMQVTPGLWFFKTRDGNYGLMRVVGFVEPQPGDRAMKVVYKLAVPVRQSEPSADDVK